jgi:hypothetical protein
VKIQLLYFPGCPHVDASRAALREALAAEQIAVGVEEIDVAHPDAPAWVRAWGSPTILIDGRDVAGQRAPSTSTGVACRLYGGGAPPVEHIRKLLAGR